MRLKLLRRRLSVTAPRMIVRSHLPWPLRWAVLALMLGFSAALALWAFEFGREIAGLDHGAKQELASLRAEVDQLRHERDQAQGIANTADSLLKAERATQERLAQQLRSLESENLAMKADLGFFERLLPADGQSSLAVRGMQAEVATAGQLRYQLLVMQPGRTVAEFNGRYELTVSGQLDGKGWSQTLPPPAQALKFRQYQRVEGQAQIPPDAVVQSLQVKVVDAAGGVRANQTLRL
jgi:hypothetical protein